MTLRGALFTGVLLLAGQTMLGQQDVQFSQYYNNKISFNPGVAGSSDEICLNSGHRSQWVGFDGAPTTQVINANIPLSVLHGGLALNVVNDQIGFFQDIAMSLSYAYQADLGDGRLGIGLAVDFRNQNVKNANWIYPDNPTDPAVLQNGSAMTPELNFGAFYNSPDWYVGLSTSRMLQSEASFSGQTARYRSKMHYYLNAGYHIAVPGANVVVTPTMLLKSDLNSNMTMDLNVNASFQNLLYGGIGLRNQDAVVLMVGYQIMPSLRATYSYDITTSSLAAFSGGSHEIFLSYCFTIEPPKKIQGSHRTPDRL